MGCYSCFGVALLADRNSIEPAEGCILFEVVKVERIESWMVREHRIETSLE